MTDRASKSCGGLARLSRWAIVPTMAIILAGCVGSPALKSTKDTFRGLYAGLISASGLDQTKEEPQQQQASVNAEPPPPAIQCPKTEVLAGTSAYTIYNRGADPKPRNVKYQGSIVNTARECVFEGSSVHIKFGFSGRVLLGPRGTAGQVTVPVRAALVKGDETVVWSQTYKIPVQISENSRAEHFVKIEDGLDYQIPEGERIYEYRILIGFEQPDSAS